MKVDYIVGLKTDEVFGMNRYQKELMSNASTDVKFNVIEFNEGHANTFKHYFYFPFIVKKKMNISNIKHLTRQDLGYLLNFNFMKKSNTVINCFDLVHLVRRQDYPFLKKIILNFLLKFNMKGLKNADMIITISEFSKNEIIKYVGYPEDKIHIVYPAVNHNNYYEKRDREILNEFNIPENEKIILYVGSEMPRQNLPFLIKGFSKLKKMMTDIKLLKVGNPQWHGAREKLSKLIGALNLEDDVIFVGYVAEEDLPKWYNAADLFVYPCLYTGWSLTCLEAMACGTPVITSSKPPLPEVVGNAGIMVDPYSTAGLAKAMYEVLTNDSLREDMRKKGLEQSKKFTWRKSAKETLKVYKDMKASIFCKLKKYS